MGVLGAVPLAGCHGLPVTWCGSLPLQGFEKWPGKHQHLAQAVGKTRLTSFSMTRIHSVRPKSILWMSFGVGIKVPCTV